MCFNTHILLMQNYTKDNLNPTSSAQLFIFSHNSVSDMLVWKFDRILR